MTESDNMQDDDGEIYSAVRSWSFTQNSMQETMVVSFPNISIFMAELLPDLCFQLFSGSLVWLVSR